MAACAAGFSYCVSASIVMFFGLGLDLRSFLPRIELITFKLLNFV